MCKKLILLVSVVLTLSMVNVASAELVAHWRLDDGAGTTATDTSGNNHHGTISGDPQWVTGHFGGALLFDGSNDYIDIEFSPEFSLNEFTVTAWVNLAAEPVESGVFGTRAGSDNTFDYKVEATMIHGDIGSGTAWLNTTIDIGNQTGTNGQGGDLALDTWYLTTYVIDNTNQEVRLNLDGDLKRTISISGTPLLMKSDQSMRIGHTGYGSEFMNGMIDDVRIYNEALTESQILAVMEDSKGYPYALGPDPADGAIYPGTWVSMSWKPGAYADSHNVYMGDNFEDVNDGTGDTFRGNQTNTDYAAGFSGYAFPEGLVPGTTYYWRIDEVNEADPDSPWKGKVWSFSIPPKTAYFPNPADDAELVDLNVKLKWTAGFGAILHYVVFGEDFDEVSNRAMGTPTSSTTYNPGALKLAKTYYWRVDEFAGAETHRGKVWSFTTLGAANNPNPANGEVDIKPSVILGWEAGSVAASHEVYFGTDADAVRNATKTSPEFKGPKTLGEESYDPGKLEFNSTYYWRVDEVNNASTDSPWAGRVLSFTTGDFFVIDDFEDYDTGDNQIWYAWHDGLGYGVAGTDPYFAGNGTGAAVGDETTASYTEETIVHGGNQSMPIAYDNNKQGYSKYSQVEYKLPDQRDWTERGVSSLSIWFRGTSDNGAEPLYVAVSNSTGTPAVVIHDNPAAAQINTWTQWIIPLSAFADQGINLTNVDKIAIGLGTQGNTTVAGGSGKIFIDDIRLIQPDISE